MQAGNWQVGARPTGVAMRTSINESLNAEASKHKADTPPPYAAGIAGFPWCDDSADPIWRYRVFRGGDVNDLANWPVQHSINRITGQVLYTSSVAFSGFVDVPTPDAPQRAANKSYVDNNFQTKSSVLASLAGLGSNNNTFAYQASAGNWQLADIAAFGRSLIAQPSAAAVQSLLGIPPSAFNGWSLGGNGYVSLNLGGNAFKIQWGANTCHADSYTVIGYPASHSSFSRAVGSGVEEVGNISAANNPAQVYLCGLNNFTVWNPGTSTTFFWISVGV